MDLKDLRRRYGAFPLEHRDWPVAREEFDRFARRGPEPLGAAALIRNQRAEILLVRESGRGGVEATWATPGGFAEPGESPEACVVRETREETGLALEITSLTKVIVCHVSNEDLSLPFKFIQFEGEAEGDPAAGRGVIEASWLDRLPVEMHFRADYVDAWMRRRPTL